MLTFGPESKDGGGVGKCVVPMRLAPVWCDRGSDAKSKSLFEGEENETRAIWQGAQASSAR